MSPGRVVFFIPLDFKQLGLCVFALALLSSNIYFLNHSSYFDQSAELMPLLHTWSLAVEEQFYLIYPFFLMGLRGLSRSTLALILLGTCLASQGLSIYWSYFYTVGNFYLLPGRAWELLIGALPATLRQRKAPPLWLRESIGWTGLMAILYAIFFYDRDTRFPGVAAIFPCVGTAAIIRANSWGMTSAGKLLALPPLVFIGLIFYSLYLWPWPLLVFARYLTFAPPSVELRLIILFVSMIFAIISWKFVETPFRKRFVCKSRIQILSFASIGAMTFMLIGSMIYQLEGLPSRLPSQALAYASASSDQGFRINVGLNDALNGKFLELGPGDKRAPVKLFLWGNSHAMATMSILDTLCKEHSIRGLAATHSETFPILGFASPGVSSLKTDSIPYNNAVIKYVKDNHVSDLIMVAAWGSYGIKSETTIENRRCINNTLSAFKDTDIRIWIMRQVPRPNWNVPRVLTLATLLDYQNPESVVFPQDEYLREASLQDKMFQGISSPSIAILDPAPLLLRPDRHLFVVDSGKVLYFDQGHISVKGAAKLRPLFEPIFKGMGKQPNS